MDEGVMGLERSAVRNVWIVSVDIDVKRKVMEWVMGEGIVVECDVVKGWVMRGVEIRTDETGQQSRDR